MRILVTSDWHGDWSTSGVVRYDDIRAAARKVTEAAYDLEADLFVFLGDACDPDSQRAHLAVEILTESASRLARDGIPSRWLVGNHDVVEDGTGAHTLCALRGMERGFGGDLIMVYDRPTVEVVSKDDVDVSIVALPYTAAASAYSPKEFVATAEVADGPVVVLGHLMIAGITVGSETVEMPRGRDVWFPIDEVRERWPRATCLNGHYHEATTFNGIIIPGSLERLTHGEESNEPGFVVVDV